MSKQKFTIGKDVTAVHVAKGEVAVIKDICGVNLYHIRGRYLTHTAFGKYFMKKDEGE